MEEGRERFAIFLKKLTQNTNCSFARVFFGYLLSAHYVSGSELGARLPVVTLVGSAAPGARFELRNHRNECLILLCKAATDFRVTAHVLRRRGSD